jgi:integrase
MAARKKAQGKRITTGDGARIVDKNPNGAGSVYAVASGGYKASFHDPTTGKRRTVSGSTKGEAAKRRDAKMAELVAARPAGRLGSAPTVAELVAWWLTDVAPAVARASTMHTYSKECRRITDHIGDTLVAELDTEVVGTLLADMRRDGLAASTTRNVRARLAQIGAQAVTLGYLAANPAVGVRVPKPSAEERKKKRVLTPEEVRRLVGALDGTRTFDAAIAMLYTSGNRASEALGLAWTDIDLDASTATIRRACTYTGGGLGARLDSTKTTGTAGLHHLAPVVVDLLRKRRRAQAADRLAAGPAWQTNTYEGEPIELVFTSAAGALPLRQNLSKSVTAACGRAGIDSTGVGTHTGRRSAITSMFQAGIPLDDIARHVGHTSTATTEIYVADLGSRPADTAALAAALFDPTVALTGTEVP